MNNISLKFKSGIIIAVASWEERFVLGMDLLIKKLNPSKIILFYYEEYAEWTEENRKVVKDSCNNTNINLIQSKLSFMSPIRTWVTILKNIENIVNENGKITLDISTMPRESIWMTCYCLHQKRCSIQYVYNKPDFYSDDWLSRDPGRPRIVYKLGGITGLRKPSTLVIITGFDVERTKQLIRFYEPHNTIIGLQKGDQYENFKKNRDNHKKSLNRNKDIIWFDIEGYSLEETLSSLVKELKEYNKNTNIILSSLGPKISSLALYKLHLKHENTALVYTPSNEYNIQYSKGLKEQIFGIL